MPRLSIVVPVYKVEKYLSKCIDSILSQTFTDFELILVDDGSPDHCGEICDKYADKDERIKVIHQKNKGVSAARNAALDLAEGTYLGFVDSDDWIEPDMFQSMVEFADEKKADIVICGVNYCEDSGSFIRRGLIGNDEFDREKLLINLYGTPNPIGGTCCNKIFLHSKVKDIRFRPDLAMAEDWVYLFECFECCGIGAQIPGCYYNVRERPNSATRSNKVQSIYNVIISDELLLSLARNHSRELEKYAVDKYLDDCIRYSNLLRKAGQKTGQAYRWKFIRIRFQMIKVLPRAYFYKMLPKSKIHGYIYSMFKG